MIWLQSWLKQDCNMTKWWKIGPVSRIGVLTVLIFDPFFFIFVDIDHQKWSEKWTKKCELWTHSPWNFEKWDQKWVKNGRVHFLAPQQPWTPHLVAGPALFYHFPPLLSASNLLESLLTGLQSIKSFLSSFFFSCSIMWMVNKMRWLPYGATTKRMDNAKTLFSNLKMCQKQTQCPFFKNGCFSVVFHLISGSIFHPIFLKNEIKNEIKNENCEHP